jgi:ribosomal protein S6--L-glutamate ligase
MGSQNASRKRSHERKSSLLIQNNNTYWVNLPLTIKELYKKFRKATTGLRIGVLASNPELYSNKRIMEAGEMRGLKCTFKH